MAPPQFGTTVTTQADIQKPFKAAQEKLTPQQKCEAGGGFWDVKTQTCLRVPPKQEAPAPPPKAPVALETFTSSETGRASGITTPGGKTYLGLSPDEVQKIATGEQERAARPLGTAPVGTAAGQQQQLLEGQQMAGQVGQFNQLGISPTGIDYGEAAISGVVGSIPGAIRMAGQFGAAAAAAGALGGSVVPGAGTALGAGAGAVIGASVGFIAGITGGMISNMKGQRTDTTTSQQRVLDEGKQTMKDWATMAKADPTNRYFYLSEYNKVAAQIDQAHRQMKLDTSQDLGKFETSLPNLAEFNSFYAPGGERDALNIEMQTALQTVVPTENYDMLELSYRRDAIK